MNTSTAKRRNKESTGVGLTAVNTKHGLPVLGKCRLIQINDDHRRDPHNSTILLGERFGKLEGAIMDKDRVKGSAKQVKGAVKQAVGKATGDAKLEAEGKADKIEGKVQNAIGGIKDTVKEALKGK